MRFRIVYQLFLFILCPMLLSAQTYSDYHPMFVDGKEWNFQIGLIELNTFDYQVDGDTVIDGAEWKKVYATKFSVFSTSSYFASIREVGRKVYAIAKDSKKARLLYDFGLEVGDKVGCGVENASFACLVDKGEKEDLLFGIPCSNYLQVKSIDFVKVSGLPHRRFYLTLYSQFGEVLADGIIWIEGVGSCMGPFLPWYPQITIDNYLFYCKEGGKVIFTSWDYSDIGTSVPAGIMKTDGYEEGLLFDLQGRRVDAEPQKGIYIRNGRKVVRTK